MNDSLSVITPEWPAPPTVHACTTTRLGGVSQPPFDSLNLGAHVDDDPAAVAENRRRLKLALALPAEPCWLTQVHGTSVVPAAEGCGVEADAAVAERPGVVCAVLTADCLPLLICDRAGHRVAAVHAGWRGLLEGVIEAALNRLTVPAEELLVWLGPAIGRDAFEVGPEVRDAFLARELAAADAFRPSPGGRWLADIYMLARLRLARAGVTAVYGGGLCTYSDPERFYSYRRDGRTGRMASLIWLGADARTNS